MPDEGGRPDYRLYYRWVFSASSPREDRFSHIQHKQHVQEAALTLKRRDAEVTELSAEVVT